MNLLLSVSDTIVAQGWFSGEIPIVPLGGSIGVFVSLLVWLIRRGDINTATTTAELRTQRDESLKRERKLQEDNGDLRQRLNHCETELLLYKRLVGPLDQLDTGSFPIHQPPDEIEG